VTAKIRELLDTVRQIERKWQKKVDVPEMFAPWMPADVAQYLVLLIEAVAEAPGEKFLEIGCGPGTKMLLARDALADMLDVSGFDRVPDGGNPVCCVRNGSAALLRPPAMPEGDTGW